jgi:hypothetical protein
VNVLKVFFCLSQLLSPTGTSVAAQDGKSGIFLVGEHLLLLPDVSQDNRATASPKI